MKIKISLLVFIVACSCKLFAQINTDQNGLKTFVTKTLSASGTQARRFEIATVGYNSYEWQSGGLLIIELFDQYFGTGYEKYTVEIGFGQGANSGSPIVKRVESHGVNHLAKITLSSPINLSTSYGNGVNRSLSIYLDILNYSSYKARITYLQDQVSTLTSYNQIVLNENPSAINIPDFSVSPSLVNENNLVVNGNVGIGTDINRTLTQKLEVNGTIRCQEVLVEATPWPDYVFAKDYKLKGLHEVEAYIKANNHLPDMPAANDVEQNGVKLSELNTKLLQKVEELTLYLIEQNKQIEDLKKENKQIKELIKKYR